MIRNFFWRISLECTEKIARYTKGISIEDFRQNNMLQDAVVRNLEIIGEAVRKLPEDFLEKHPDLPWREIAALRNILAHACFGLDLEIIWTLAIEETPSLSNQIGSIIKTRSF
ncbi:MAG: DUF86 domain-containing protein [Thermovirgaceae bacterium]|nr:DUF86 domain-containing protein [Thermovirgaceae bacterium]